MTAFIPAYDTEAPSCLDACRKIVEVHHRYKMPATFFIVGKTLEASPDEYRRLLDDPLFEIASHSYSHKLLRDHPLGGPGASLGDMKEEIVRGKEIVEHYFPDRRCLGMRTPYGFPNGLSGAPEILRTLCDSGHEYVSSALWGEQFSMPAPLKQASDYAADGFPGLREFPGHGWHENVLKSDKVRLLLLFPPQFPEAVPPAAIKTPGEEFLYNNKPFIDRAVRENLAFVSLVWHPWSLLRFDPAMEMLDRTFTYLQEENLRGITYAQLLRGMP